VVDSQRIRSRVDYVLADGLGTPRVIQNARGTTIWSWPLADNPFGERQARDRGYTYNLRFPGQYFDQETGLHQNVNRDYDPAVGRYRQADPTGFKAGQWSLYAYVSSSPSNAIDALGLDGIYLLKPDAVPINVPIIGGEAGHAAVLIGSDDSGGWNFYEENGIVDGQQKFTTAHFDTFQDFQDTLGDTYRWQVGYHASAAQDRLMNDYAKAHLHDKFSGLTNNCADFARSVLRAGGFKAPVKWDHHWLPTVPAWQYEDIMGSDGSYIPPMTMPAVHGREIWEWNAPAAHPLGH
jgi:RHS repeat-associated protein